MRSIPFVLIFASLAGCGSEYTIVNRSAVRPTASSQIAARGLVGDAPAVTEHLAQAYEVYTAQLTLLKQRRNKVRARERGLRGAVIGTLTAGSAAAVVVGATAAGSEDDRIQGASFVALGTIALSLGLSHVRGEQEDPIIPDMKARQLQKDFERMLDRVKELESEGEVVTGDPVRDAARKKEVTSEISTTIEAFITEATGINIKG
ncbi:MAG TPA: hypothetical protein VM261_14330 [Kofleriaceae bacterium]|nr:hypothetical protein [Kofleriaceae bacterium]